MFYFPFPLHLPAILCQIEGSAIQTGALELPVLQKLHCSVVLFTNVFMFILSLDLHNNPMK